MTSESLRPSTYRSVASWFTAGSRPAPLPAAIAALPG
jgi:hypothetical protein